MSIEEKVPNLRNGGLTPLFRNFEICEMSCILQPILIVFRDSYFNWIDNNVYLYSVQTPFYS